MDEYPHSSTLAGNKMQGTGQNLLREKPVMSLEGQFSPGLAPADTLLGLFWIELCV